MNLGGSQIINRQSMMPSSSGTSWKSGGVAGAGDGVPDQFPAGLRVLVVDDDPTCLMILEKMLRTCNYEVTKCNRAELALSHLRENKKGFDVVISDVHMPDMDGFKLLEHIGLEMDLPVIMMSADDSKSVVMKGVTHGACDYLIKPVRIEAIRNIWQHVVRKMKNEWKDFEPSASAEEQKPQEEPDYSSSANEGHNWKNTKRRKDEDNDADDRDDSSSLKKPRVVWSVELHQQFVAAVNQLGIDKAVPKKILELMNVPGLTRENVASHLQTFVPHNSKNLVQKYRLYLRRLSGSQHPGSMTTGFMGSPEAGYGSIASLNGLELQALAASGQLGQLPPQSLATLQAAALGRSNNSKSPISVPVIDQRNLFSFENPKSRYTEVQSQHNSKQINLLPGIPTNMEPKQFASLHKSAQHSFGSMNNQVLIQMGSQNQIQSQNQSQSQTQSQLTRGGMVDLATTVYNPVSGQNQIQCQSQSQTQSQLTRSRMVDMATTVYNPVGGQIQSQTQSQLTRGGMVDLATTVYHPVGSQASSLVDFSLSHKADSSGSSYPLGSNLGIPNLMATSSALQVDGNLDTKVARTGIVPTYDIFNDFNQNGSREWGLQDVSLAFDPSQQTMQEQNRNLISNKMIFSPGNGSSISQQRNTYEMDNSSRVKAESYNGGSSLNTLYSEQYGQDDLFATILKQPQEGVGQAENEFGFDTYALDDLPVSTGKLIRSEGNLASSEIRTHRTTVESAVVEAARDRATVSLRARAYNHLRNRYLAANARTRSGLKHIKNENNDG